MDSNVETVLLIRHARSTANDDPTIYLTTPDHAIPLACPDDDEAALAAAKLVSALDLELGSICSWHSTYLRCQQTESLVMRLVMRDAYHDAPARFARRESFLLREQEFGDWDGLTEEEMAQKDPERYARRQRMSDKLGRFYFRYPSGESRADVVQRMAIFLGKLHRSRFRHHVIFLHGVTQRAFRMAWFNYPVEWFEAEPNPQNASALLINRAGGRWVERYLE